MIENQENFGWVFSIILRGIEKVLRRCEKSMFIGRPYNICRIPSTEEYFSCKISYVSILFFGHPLLLSLSDMCSSFAAFIIFICTYFLFSNASIVFIQLSFNVQALNAHRNGLYLYRYHFRMWPLLFMISLEIIFSTATIQKLRSSELVFNVHVRNANRKLACMLRSFVTCTYCSRYHEMRCLWLSHILKASNSFLLNGKLAIIIICLTKKSVKCDNNHWWTLITADIRTFDFIINIRGTI